MTDTIKYRDGRIQKQPGQPPHHWVKICPKCGGAHLTWFWDGKLENSHPNQQFCADCEEWVIPSRRREFI